MHKKITVLLFTLMFLLVLPFLSYANEVYDNWGHTPTNATYTTGQGFFNTDNSPTLTGTATLTSGSDIPLVGDLDGDGTREIVVYDAPTIKVYRDNTLTPVVSYTSPVAQNDAMGISIYDWDGDGYSEILFPTQGSTTMEILQYNGSEFVNERNYTSSGTGQKLTACRGVYDCVLLEFEEGTSNVLYVNHFNSTEMSLHDTIGALQSGCFPRNPAMHVVDYDNDGSLDYVTNAFTSSGGFQANSLIVVEKVGSLLDAPLKDSEIRTATQEWWELVEVTDGSTASCSSALSDGSVTNALVMDVDGFTDTLEIIIGTETSDNSCEFHIFDSLGEEKAEIPSGFLVANTECDFLGSLFPVKLPAQVGDLSFTQSTPQICMTVYEQDSGISGISGSAIEYLCGDISTSGVLFGENPILFVYDKPETLRNITDTYKNRALMSHAGQTKGSSSSSSEIYSPYGVISIGDWVYIGNPLSVRVPVISTLPEEGLTNIPVDADNNNRTDILILKSSSLRFWIDGFINDGAIITDESVYNPCPDQTWKKNTSFSATVNVIDLDALKSNPSTDDLSVRVILYEGDANAQDSGWINVSGDIDGVDVVVSTSASGESFIANKTTSNGNIQVMARDTGDPSDVDVINQPFSVANNGLEFGESTCNFGQSVEQAVQEEIVLSEGQIDVSGNSVARGIGGVNELTGGLGSLTIWIIIMAISGLGVIGFLSQTGIPPVGMVLGFGIVETALLVMGYQLGFIGVGIIILFVILAIAVISIFVASLISGTRARG